VAPWAMVARIAGTMAVARSSASTTEASPSPIRGACVRPRQLSGAAPGPTRLTRRTPARGSGASADHNHAGGRRDAEVRDDGAILLREADLVEQGCVQTLLAAQMTRER